MAITPSKAITSATTRLFVSAALPATYDAAGFQALTWTEVAEVSNLGEFGGTTNIVKHIPLGTATVVKRSGSVDYGDLSLDLAYHTGSDTNILQAQFDNRLSTSFKVVFPTSLGQTAYFTGIVSNNAVNVSTADSILMSKSQIAIDNTVLFV